jgi:hypothetical protein
LTRKDATTNQQQQQKELQQRSTILEGAGGNQVVKGGGGGSETNPIVVGNGVVGITNPMNAMMMQDQSVSLELFVFPNFAAKEKWLLTLSSAIWDILANKRTRYFAV